VTHIVHAAGDVHMGRPLAQARALAVGSARHVVQLARALAARGGLEKVEVLSTVGVGGRAPWPVPERWLDEPRSFHNSYERSKAEAEAYLREQRDIPLTVHRPSMVVGDSESGRAIRFQIFHAICDFLSGQQTLGLVPRTGSVRLDTVPNDYVADAVLWSSRSTETTGRVLHLCSGPSTSVRLDELGAQVRGLLGSLGASVPRPVPVAPAVYRRAAWLGRHVAPRALRGRARFIELLLEYLADERGFENGQTRRMLETADISLPAPRSYLPAVLARYYCSAS
jgi:nucleoside-diphosphate-sugar epimerase